MKIKVSSATFNEIVQAFIKEGRKYEGGVQITIEKSDELSQPIDFVLANKRYECLCEAVKYRQTLGHEDNVIDLANEMYQWMLTGEVVLKSDVRYRAEIQKIEKESKKEEWK